MPESAATNGFGFENPIYDESNTENGATADDYLDVNSTEVLKPTGANSSRGDVAASASGAATLEAVNKRVVYLGVGSLLTAILVIVAIVFASVTHDVQRAHPKLKMQKALLRVSIQPL